MFDSIELLSDYILYRDEFIKYEFGLIKCSIIFDYMQVTFKIKYVFDRTCK